jgi:hypothetical protein
MCSIPNPPLFLDPEDKKRGKSERKERIESDRG